MAPPEATVNAVCRVLFGPAKGSRCAADAPNLGPHRLGWEVLMSVTAAHDLRKNFGEPKDVDGISLTVPRGEVLGFLGPNGAGKSTTMKMLTAFLEPDSGSARIAGYDVLDQPKLAKARLGYLPEGAPLYAEMTPRKLLQFVAGLRGYEKHEADRRTGIAVERTGLEPVLDRTIETLSKG